MRQRGMTLLEVTVAAAIVVVTTVCAIALSRGWRLYGVDSSVRVFDASLAYARALAGTSGNGATLVFANGALRVYSGRPTSSSGLSVSSIAPVTLEADVRERVIGSPPFTVFLDSAGHASAMRGIVLPGSLIASDPGCPAGETSVALSFADSASTAAREFPCNAVAAGSPDAVGTVPP